MNVIIKVRAACLAVGAAAGLCFRLSASRAGHGLLHRSFRARHFRQLAGSALVKELPRPLEVKGLMQGLKQQVWSHITARKHSPPGHTDL
ncbi:hypothetical protein AAFF_G00062550 [Aldrovandia affinis]|uniref:Uncharacterized protein n=1 Tax=Aldrovandia affinis TaxID=143900 RepID=A0AAD7RZP4_9TELE|nr:hypothetical protein AAFF_G00062550 [Aldrovandia affinis]